MTKHDFKTKINIGALIVLFIVAGTYTYFKMKDALFGSNIKISGIFDGQVFNSPIVNITGTAKKMKLFAIDGRAISFNGASQFNESLVLIPGYNIVNIHSEDSFGRQIEKNYRVYYKSNT